VAVPSSDSAETDEIKRGAYLATAGDCIACHTAKAGKPFAGGLPIGIPMLGTIYSSNITPDKATGIGNWSLADFDQAMRHGISKDGHNLYPAMPYVSYAKLNDADIASLYAYFEKGVQPVSNTLPKSSIPWPMNMRWPLKLWNVGFLPAVGYQPKAGQSEAWNRGAYLVQGLAHCSTCHTPRGVAMQEVALDETGKGFLGGSVLAGWNAYNITSAKNSGIGGWTQTQLVQYLRTGSVPGLAQAAGPMGEAVEHSFSHLQASDLDAIATYIRTVPAVEDGSAAPRQSLGNGATDVATLRGVDLSDTVDPARLYLGNCASCHQANGKGSPDGYYPSLIHNSTVGASDPGNMVQVILQGIHRNAAGNDVGMPGFASELSDAQIAALSNYLSATFGNPHSSISADAVAKLRKVE
jgi:mono/diheme cytochrome c family protein